MRSVLAVVCPVAFLFSSCSGSPSEMLGGTESVGDMLRAGDTKVCASLNVQRTAVRVIGNELRFLVNIDDFEKAGGRINFTEVNAREVNKDIGQVSCNANMQLLDHPYPINYRVRPSLTKGQDFIVEVEFSQRSDDLGQAFIVEMAKQIREAGGASSGETGRAAEEPAVESDRGEVDVEAPRLANCRSHDDMVNFLEAEGLSLSDQSEGGGTGTGSIVEVYVSGYDDGAVRHVLHGPDEDCLFDEEPDDHAHSSVDGTLK
jgi:hypothetical protein